MAEESAVSMGPWAQLKSNRSKQKCVSAIYLDIIHDFRWDLTRVDSHTICTTSDYIKPPQVGTVPERARERDRHRHTQRERA